MHTFKAWLEQVHPDFDVEEGLLQAMHPTANSVVGKSNAAIGAMGILGRLYTPMLGLGAPEPPRKHIEDPPAMVAKATNDKPVSRKPLSLTGIPHLDQLGNIVGEPLSQAWWDAADWVPGHMPGGDTDRRDNDQKIAARMKNQAFAASPLDPPEDAIDPTIPKKPRLNPRMKAALRAKKRRLT